MARDESMRRGGFDRLTTAAIVLACLVLSALLLRGWLGTGPQVPEASDVAAPQAEPPAEASGPVHSVEAPGAQQNHERPSSTSSPSQPQEEKRAAPQPRLPTSQTAGLPPSAPPLEAGAPNFPGHVDRTDRSASAAATALSPSRPSAIGPLPLDSVAARPPTSLPGLNAPMATASHEGPRPQEAAGPSPRESPTPEPKEPAEDESTSDRTPPALEILRFDPPVVEGGAVTRLTIQARDDLSGVKSVRGEIRSPSGLALLAIWPQDSQGGNAFTYAITIPRGAETGTWFVKWLSLTDMADNSALIQASSAGTAPPGGTFTVYSDESDSIAPEVLQISFDKATLVDEDRNVIRVEARDDRSGVASMMGACQSPSKSALVWFYGALNPDSGLWEGDVVLPRNADCGEWMVQQLSMKDKAGNTVLLIGDSPILARAGFRVARDDCDSSPPTLDAFDLSPTIVSNQTATEILVTARVSDVGSGAVTMTGWFVGPVSIGGQVPKNYFRCSPDPASPEAPWTGRIQVPQLAAKGIWKVGVIRLEDKALNFREYTSADPILAGRVFEVQ